MFKSITDVPEGFAIISACGINQLSYEDEKYESTGFLPTFLEGITGKADTDNDKVISVSDLYDYIAPKVKEWTFTKLNASQIPNFRANFSGVYTVSKLPSDTPKTQESLEGKLFSGITIWQPSKEMYLKEYNANGTDIQVSDYIEGSIQELLLELRKEYGFEGFADNDKQIDFQDGAIYRSTKINEKSERVYFSIGVGFNYTENRRNIIDNLLLKLDDADGKWDQIVFVTPKKFSFNLLEK